jgi:hypothetical protein
MQTDTHLNAFQFDKRRVALVFERIGITKFGFFGIHASLHGQLSQLHIELLQHLSSNLKSIQIQESKQYIG